MKDIALITLHGMGKERPYYFSDLEDGLKKRLGGDWTRISFQNVHYAPILQEPQDQLWEDIIRAKENDIDCTTIRKFLLFGIGDAGSIEYSGRNNPTKYLEVQKEIQKALNNAYSDFNQDKSKPVVIVAHSLGSQVISNYLWDAQHNKHIFENTDDVEPNKLDFMKLTSMHNLFTTGCNIPLFISGLSDRQCFKKPNNKFKWDNYYDPDDVLGWPLSQLGNSYKNINDHDINAGGIFTSGNVFSHGGYWSDSDVIRPLANTLMNLLS